MHIRRCLRTLPRADSMKTAPVKEGYLMKKGARFKLWHKRYVLYT